MKEKQEIDEKHRNKVLEQYEVWIQKKHGNSIYKKLKEQRYFISLKTISDFKMVGRKRS